MTSGEQFYFLSPVEVFQAYSSHFSESLGCQIEVLKKNLSKPSHCTAVSVRKRNKEEKTCFWSLVVSKVSWEKMFSVQPAPLIIYQFHYMGSPGLTLKCWWNTDILSSGTTIQGRQKFEFHVQMSHIVIMATSGA